jgi:hypothetical protein
VTLSKKVDNVTWHSAQKRVHPHVPHAGAPTFLDKREFWQTEKYGKWVPKMGAKISNIIVEGISNSTHFKTHFSFGDRYFRKLLRCGKTFKEL